MLEIVENYIRLKKQIPMIIRKSGYSDKFIAEKIGIRVSSFNLKMHSNNWSGEEVLKIIKLISVKDSTKQNDLVLINEAFDKKVVSSDEFEKQMGWQR